MRWLSRGLCLCMGAILLTSCAQDKKLPSGERISILDEDNFLTIENADVTLSFPKAYTNQSWSQDGLNSQHIVGNLLSSSLLEEVWTSSFGEGLNKRDIILPAPVIQNGRVFVMDAEGKVSAYNLENGTNLWENSLTAKDINTKELNSKASGLAVDNNILYATTGFGGIYAMDSITGAPKWRKIMESPIRISPTVTQNAVLIQTVDNKLYALDKMTGNELWRFGVAHEDTVIAGGASPAFSSEDNIVVAGFSNGEIVVLNATIGTPLWSYALVSNNSVNSSTEINTISSYPIVENGSIYAVSNGDILVSLDIRTGETIWQKEIGSMQNMLLVGDYLFIISNKNILYSVNKNDGNIMWSIDMRDYIYDEEENGEVFAHQPIMIDGNILLAFSNGRVFKIKASKGLITAKTHLDTGIGSNLVVAKNRVVAISNEADITILK